MWSSTRESGGPDFFRLVDLISHDAGFPWRVSACRRKTEDQSEHRADGFGGSTGGGSWHTCLLPLSGTYSHGDLQLWGKMRHAIPYVSRRRGKWLATQVSVCTPGQDSVSRHFSSRIHAFRLHPEQVPTGLTIETDEPVSGLNGQEEGGNSRFRLEKVHYRLGCGCGFACSMCPKAE